MRVALSDELADVLASSLEENVGEELMDVLDVEMRRFVKRLSTEHNLTQQLLLLVLTVQCIGILTIAAHSRDTEFRQQLISSAVSLGIRAGINAIQNREEEEQSDEAQPTH